MPAGEPRFEGESAQSILMKRATAAARPTRDHRGDVPAALTTALERMLAKDPAARYQTAEEASRALVEAVPAAAGATVPRHSSVPAAAIRLVVALTLLAAVGLVALTLLREPPPMSVAAPIPDSLVPALLPPPVPANCRVGPHVL